MSQRFHSTPTGSPRVALASPGLGIPELVHDLRQELAVVRHLVADLTHASPADQVTHRTLVDLQTQVAVIDNLVLTASRTPRWEPVDVASLAGSVVTTTQSVHDGEILLRALPVAPVAAPAVLLRRVLTNVIVNACEAAPRGAVTVRVLPDGAWVLVEVEDEGESGPPLDDVPGLGQWIVHAVIRDCGGAVARSQVVTGGRRIRLHLPVMRRRVGP